MLATQGNGEVMVVLEDLSWEESEDEEEGGEHVAMVK